MAKGQPSVPNPVNSAQQGINAQIQDYPFQYLINALSQTGGTGTLTPPGSTTPQTYDFSGLGTAEVNNQLANQLAQVLLNTQQGQGGQFINQSLQDLMQADPTGQLLYSQLFGQIGQQGQTGPPDLALANQVQGNVQNTLTGSQSLTPEELMQTQQAVRGQQAATGITLGNAPTQQETNAVVSAQDSKNNAAQKLAGQFMGSGMTPTDLEAAYLEQQLGNLGSFQTGQSPLTELSQVQNAGYGAAPYSGTGYSAPNANEGQAGMQGIADLMNLYSTNLNWSQNTPNPYMAGISTGINTFGALA